MYIILTITKDPIYGGYQMPKPVMADTAPAEAIDFICFTDMRDVRDYLNVNHIEDFRRIEPGCYQAALHVAAETVAYLRAY